MKGGRGFWALAMSATLPAVYAANASIDVTTFPTLSVADGRSTVTVTATLRTRDGNLVPDGTRVVFSVDKGTFREPVVETRNGIARAILQTATEPGFAKVNVSALSYQSTTSVDYEYVKDRSLLSTANEYIEVNSPTDLRYSMDYKTLEATGGEQTAVVSFRDITIRADQIQVNVPSYEVRAKNAILKIGDKEFQCGQLYYKLNQRVGFGTTTFKFRPTEIKPYADSFQIIEGEERETYGVAEIKSGEARQPSGQINRTMFEFKDVTDSVSVIAAKKAVAYPRKEIQFQKADVYVAEARIMRVPLFKVSVFTNSPVVTDQMLKINENSISVDYPYYLDLAPGRSSLLRFSLGRGGGRGLGAGSRGMYVNYEYAWNKGDELQGEAVIQNVGRNDWGITTRQYWRIDDRTDLNLQLDMPAHRSLYGNAQLGRQFDGWSVRAFATDGRSIQGPSFRTQSTGVSFDKDPIKVGRLPLNISYSASVNSNANSYGGTTSRQTTMGVNGIMRMQPVAISRQTSLNGSFQVSKLTGSNAPGGMAFLGSMTLSQALRGGGLAVSYDYLDDGFTSSLLGRHSLTVRGNFIQGPLETNFYALRSLDVNRQSYQLDASYRFSRDWRLSYGYTYDRFLQDSFFDSFFVLGYRIGYREFGLTYSQRTKRFGFQVLGSTLY